jgi:hypothetical protein
LLSDLESSGKKAEERRQKAESGKQQKAESRKRKVETSVNNFSVLFASALLLSFFIRVSVAMNPSQY